MANATKTKCHPGCWLIHISERPHGWSEAFVVRWTLRGLRGALRDAKKFNEKARVFRIDLAPLRIREVTKTALMLGSFQEGG